LPHFTGGARKKANRKKPWGYGVASKKFRGKSRCGVELLQEMVMHPAPDGGGG
jgi:hypothetical protein